MKLNFSLAPCIVYPPLCISSLSFILWNSQTLLWIYEILFLLPISRLNKSEWWYHVSLRIIGIDIHKTKVVLLFFGLHAYIKKNFPLSVQVNFILEGCISKPLAAQDTGYITVLEFRTQTNFAKKGLWGCFHNKEPSSGAFLSFQYAGCSENIVSSL